MSNETTKPKAPARRVARRVSPTEPTVTPRATAPAKAKADSALQVSDTYIVKVVTNPDFDGIRIGIPFSKGHAVITRATMDPSLGHNSPHDVALQMMELGSQYVVSPV